MTLKASLSWVIYHKCNSILLSFNQHKTFDVPSFTDSKDMIVGQNFMKGHVTLTTPIGTVCHPKANFLG